MKAVKKIVCIQSEFPALSSTFILDEMVGLIERGLPLENWASRPPAVGEIHPAVTEHKLLDRTQYLNLSRMPTRSEEDWLREFVTRHPFAELDHIDAFHVHYGSLFRRFEPLFRAWDGFVLVSFHGHDASRFVRVNGPHCYDYLFERANVITTPSDAMKAVLVGLGCPADKIRIHRYGVDLRQFRPETRQPSADGIVRLLSVGRLVEKKGFEFSLRALAELPDLTHVRQQIIGEGPLQERLASLVRELGLEPYVEFLGAKNKDGVIAAMRQADALVLTSVTAADGDQEGLPVTLIEAQAMGLPVISTIHAGIPELVRDGETGFLVREKDIPGTAAAIQRLIDDADLRRRFSAAAPETALASFDIQTLNDQLAACIRTGIAEVGVVPPARVPWLNRPSPAAEALTAALAKVGWTPYQAIFERHLDRVDRANVIASPRASLVLISWMFTPDVLETVRALRAQTPADVEIVFVNNGAPDDDMRPIMPLVDTFVRLNNNTGAYLARNIGAAFATGAILIFVDDDGLPAPGFVQAHLDAFARYDAVAVRGRVLPKRTDIDEQYLREHYGHYDRGLVPFPDFPNVEGNSSFRAESFYRIGGWDNLIAFGGGGLDISIRLLALHANFRTQIYAPKAVLLHDPKMGAASESKVARQEASRKRLTTKHPQWHFFRDFWELYKGREDLLIKKAGGPAVDPADPMPAPAVPGKVNLYERLGQRHWRNKAPLYEMSFERADLITERRSPSVSVVVVAWKYSAAIADNLRALGAHDREHTEIIFVNNGGSDADFEAVRPLVDVYVKLTSNTGAYLSRNIGSIFANAPILLFVDDDAMPEGDLVAAHRRAFEDFDVVAVRGVVRPKTKNPLNRLAKHYDLGQQPFPVFADIEGNTSYAAMAFFAAGGWDDHITFGGGGVELSIRLFNQTNDPRKQIYSPGPVILHDYVASEEHLAQKKVKQEASRARLREKYPFYDKYLKFWGQFHGRPDALLRRQPPPEVRA